MTAIADILKSPPKRPPRPQPPYAFTWGYFYAGLQDWLREKKLSSLGRPQPSEQPGKGVASVARGLAGALLALLLLALAAQAVVPGASRIMGESGVSFLSAGAFALVFVAAMACVAIPFYLVLVGYGWVHAMSRRGWELETGQRVAIPSVV